jgi:hypothetical protein
MKLGTLISVSGAIDFPQDNKFHDITRAEEPKGDSQLPSKLARKAGAEDRSQSDRLARLCRWIIVALLSLAAVA